jgi:hypothetical protein
LLDLPAAEAAFEGIGWLGWAEQEMGGLDRRGRFLGGEVVFQAMNGIGASGIVQTNFLRECGDGCAGALVVMMEGVEDVKPVLGLLSAGEGAEFHGQKRADLTDSSRQILSGTEEVHARDLNATGGGQGAVSTGEDVRWDIVHHHGAPGGRRMLGEEVHEDIESVNGLHKARATELISGETEALRLKVHLQAAVLAHGCVETDAEVGIEGYGVRELPGRGKVAAKVFGHQATQQNQVVVPGSQCRPGGEEAAFRQANPSRVVE